MRFRLRTLLGLLAVLPPLLAVVWLWILPLKPHTYGDAVLIGSLDAMAVLLALLFLQWGWAAIISQLPGVGGK